MVKKNSFTIFFLCLTIFSFSLYFFSNELLNSNQLLYNSLAEKLTTSQIEIFITSHKKWQWLTYGTIPILLFEDNEGEAI